MKVIRAEEMGMCFGVSDTQRNQFESAAKQLIDTNRAYKLARWYRERESKEVLGGLHVISCPDEAAPHADALAIGDGSGVGLLWRRGR